MMMMMMNPQEPSSKFEVAKAKEIRVFVASGSNDVNCIIIFN